MREGNFDLAKAQGGFQERPWPRPGWPAQRCGQQAEDAARQMAELTNAIQKFFIENTRLGIPVMFHEECLHGHAAIGGDEFSAAHRPGRDVQSRAGREAFHDDGRGSARARRAPGAHAGRGCGARSALGPRRGNLRRRSVSGHATGHRGGARFPGRRDSSRTKSASSPR